MDVVNNFNNEVTNRIKLVLTNKKISVNQLKDIFDMKQSTLNKQMNGDTPIPILTLGKFIEHFQDVSMEWLFRGNGEMFKDLETIAPKSQNKSLLDRISELIPNCGDEEFYEGQLEEKDKTIRSLNKRLNALETMLKALDKEVDKLEYDIDEETKYRLIADDAAPYNKSKV